ncbi:ABC transporter substrate-binding protein, partial [Azospirillum brasilense]|uniref:ABC transporter substrate-binding protein n=1 Tax=Azospirillum brasilense TaxID=192 RepID=UPI001FFF6B5E
ASPSGPRHPALGALGAGGAAAHLPRPRRRAGAAAHPAIEPLVLDFQQLRPDVTIEYKDMDTADLYAEAVATPAKGTAETPDLLISSASDLQVKLVNDGFTQPHRSALTDALPDWANWRDEAFGFTFEPAVIAYNRDLLPDAEVPRTATTRCASAGASPPTTRPPAASAICWPPTTPCCSASTGSSSQ